MNDDFDTLDGYLGLLWEQKGSDLLLTVGAPPMIRVDGLLTRMPAVPSLRPDDTRRFLMSLLNESQTAEFTRRRELDFSFNWRDQARLRASAFTQRGTIAVALRLIRY